MPSPAAKFDWWISFVQREKRLEGIVEYSTDLFDAETIHRHIANLTTLLHSIVSDPDQRLSRLEVMAQDERRLLDTWNQTAVTWPNPRLPFQQFETRPPDISRSWR